MNSEVILDDITSIIYNCQKILILCHESPDGDAIGSTMAMYLGLKSLKKDVHFILDDFAKCFDMFSTISERDKKASGVYDLVITLDCATKNRVYDPNNCFDKANHTISIDHHVSNTYFADFNYVEGNSPSTSQILIKILKKLGVVFNKDIGDAIMVGIITDTGGFRHDTVTEETFDFAAKSLGIGVNISDIYNKVFQSKTLAQFKLHQIANSRLELLYKNKIAFTYITLEDEKKCKALKGDHEGIVNIGQSIEGVLVSVFLHECDKGFKISLRSNGLCDVSEVVKKFDGGGHKNASGCMIEGNLEYVKELIIKRIKKYL